MLRCFLCVYVQRQTHQQNSQFEVSVFTHTMSIAHTKKRVEQLFLDTKKKSTFLKLLQGNHLLLETIRF